jgi:hypothetical protein
MSAARNSLLGSPLVLTGMLALVLAGAWRTREWFRDTHPDEVLRPESAEWHEAYDRWVEQGPAAWPGVLDALQGDSGPARRMALLAVATLRDAPPKVRDEVRQLLSAPDPADRREALVAWTGADRDPLQALDELATACGDENAIVRGTALELMLCIGPDSISRLEPLAVNRRHPAQTACLQALLSLNASTPSVMELARSLWRDEQLDTDVRRYALALLVCAGQATLDELEQGVETGQPLIQSIALWGIREMGRPARSLAEKLLTLKLPLKLSIPREQTMDGQIVRFPAQAYVSMPLTLDQIDPSQSVPQIAFDENAGEEQMTDFTLFSVLASIASPGELDLTSLEERLSTLPALDQLRAAQQMRQLGWTETRFGDQVEALFLEGGTAIRNPAALLLRTEAPQRAERLAASLRQQLAADPSENERRVLLDQISKLTTSSETASSSAGETTPKAATAPDPEFISHLLVLAEGPDDALAISALQTLASLGRDALGSLPQLVSLATAPRVLDLPGTPEGQPPAGSGKPLLMTTRPNESSLPVARPDPFIGAGVPRRQTALATVVAINQIQPRPISEVSQLLRRSGEPSPMRALAFEVEAAASEASQDRLALAREVFDWGDEMLQRRVVHWLGGRLSQDPESVPLLLNWLKKSLSGPLVVTPQMVGLNSQEARHADEEVNLRLLLLSYLQSQTGVPDVTELARECREQLKLLPIAGQRPGWRKVPLRDLLRQRRDQLQALDQILAPGQTSS